jgi:hypothetical protein
VDANDVVVVAVKEEDDEDDESDSKVNGLVSLLAWAVAVVVAVGVTATNASRGVPAA